MDRIGARTLIALLAFGAAGALLAEDLTRLPLGDPNRRDRSAPVVLDAITDTRTGEILTAEELVSRLTPVQVLLIGEEHASLDHHRVQERIIRALHAAGRQVIIGLEMFPGSAQPVLDRWTAGALPEQPFLDASGWYDTWGYRFDYYRPIFELARDQRLPLAGINAPRAIVKAVREAGPEGLSSAERAELPPRIDTSSAEHRRLFLAYMGGAAGHASRDGQRFEDLYRAQCTWDAIMGFGTLRALQKLGNPRQAPIVVALLGSGHVAYGLGAQRQIGADSPVAVASLMPVPVADAQGRVVTTVQASYADFIWGIPAPGPPAWPELGASLAGPPAADANRIVRVLPGSPAAQAGAQPGDVVIRLGDRPVRSPGDLNRAMAGFQWGDSTSLAVRRGDQDLNLRLAFRRPELAAPPATR